MLCFLSWKLKLKYLQTYHLVKHMELQGQQGYRNKGLLFFTNEDFEFYSFSSKLSCKMILITVIRNSVFIGVLCNNYLNEF